MAYLLDTSVFITAHRVHYGFDFCPAFWDWLKLQHENSKVFSIEKVLEELKGQTDPLTDWGLKMPASFFIRPDAGTGAYFREVSQWAQAQNYNAPAVNTFLQTADYYLVAQAKQKGHIVVTYEVPGKTPKRIKIPDACLDLGIPCILPHELLRREGAKFIL